MTKSINFFLVDDDRDDASLFEEVLKEIDPSINFEWAMDGQDALDRLLVATSLPDLIFLDLNMPKMTGRECLQQLKQYQELRDIPVVMYSTSSYSRDIEEAMVAGAISFITKPPNVKELKHILSSLVINIHKDLQGSLRSLSNEPNSFIVC